MTYDIIGQATTFGISKAFDVSGYTVNTALNYTSFSSDSAFIEEQESLYLVVGVGFLVD
jgi:hypothetical protein